MNRLSHFRMRPSCANSGFFNTSAPQGIDFSQSVDQFMVSDFFKDKNGARLPLESVFMNPDNSDELREKLQQFMVERDVSSMADRSDEEIFNTLSSRYDDRGSLLAKLKSKIATLRSQPAAE